VFDNDPFTVTPGVIGVSEQVDGGGALPEVSKQLP
jgi:hypothetical protein